MIPRIRSNEYITLYVHMSELISLKNALEYTLKIESVGAVTLEKLLHVGEPGTFCGLHEPVESHSRCTVGGRVHSRVKWYLSRLCRFHCASCGRSLN